MRSSKIVLEANPDYRGFIWDFKSGTTPTTSRSIARDEGQEDAAGRAHRDQHHRGGPGAAARLPERRARPDEHGGPLAPNVLDGGKLKPEFAKKGVRCRASSTRRSVYVYWNLQDPIVGGLTKEKIALRRAMAMAYNVDEEISVIRNGQAVEARVPDSARRRRPRSELQVAASSTTRRSPTRCSTSSATRRAPTAGATCRTASRLPSAMRRVPIRSAGSWTSCGRRRSTASACGWKSRRTSFPSC